MIPGRFSYAAPDSIAGVLDVLSRDPEGTTIIGGGTLVVPEMNQARRKPRAVVDLRRAGLSDIASEGDHIRIGAMCTYAQLLESELIDQHLGLLSEVAAGITGGRQIVAQGTIGGSLCAARPQSDIPAALLTIGARAIVAGASGERRIALSDYFTGAMRTILDPTELLLGVEVAPAPGYGVGYVKLKRGASSWPIATAACLARRDTVGRCVEIRLAVGGVNAVPVMVDIAEVLAGHGDDAERIDLAASRVVDAITEPWSDVLAPAEYRLAIAKPVAKRAIARALHDAHSTTGGSEQ